MRHTVMLKKVTTYLQIVQFDLDSEPTYNELLAAAKTQYRTDEWQDVGSDISIRDAVDENGIFHA
jgi:hypothetical protein